MTAKAATPKKAKAPKKPAEHPTYAVMISAAIVAMKDRKGSSKQAIEKYVCANYKVGPRYAGPFKLALKKGVETGALVQTKGVGASGSFKLAKVEKPAAKKPAAKKPAAKKAVKKPAAKKPAAKKAVKKSPKKATKKPAAKKAAPKKVAKKASPKKVVKKPAAKKATKAKK